MTATNDDHFYRRGVGVMLLNADGQVWVGRRISGGSLGGQQVDCRLVHVEPL